MRKVHETLARLLRIVAILASLAMISSFVLFGLDQASGASRTQQALVDASGNQALGPSLKAPTGHGLRHDVDNVNDVLAAPFSSLAPGDSGSWEHRGFDLGIGLLLYGFGLGALARVVGLSRTHHSHHAAAPATDPWGV